MTIFELYSKRQKKLRGEIPEFFIYDNIPYNLRIQILQIINDVVGKQSYAGGNAPNDFYINIYNILCREYGKLFLVHNASNIDSFNQVQMFFLNSQNIEELIDVIELAFKYIDKTLRNDYSHFTYNETVKLNSDEAIDELNYRFKENGIGYIFEGGQIIRLDSTYVHEEITKPTIALLSNDKFLGATEEYLKAHNYYRDGLNKECIAECLKAFESVMKSICVIKGWTYNQNDTAKRLIQICFSKELVPKFTQNQFTSLQNLLESGIPTIRNKLGGHGQGQIPITVDNEITRYALNLTGTNIILLIEQSRIH